MTESNAFTCPKCGGEAASVVDSRSGEFMGHYAVMRRRECGGCGQRLKTYELPVAWLDGAHRDVIIDQIIKALHGMKSSTGANR